MGRPRSAQIGLRYRVGSPGAALLHRTGYGCISGGACLTNGTSSGPASPPPNAAQKLRQGVCPDASTHERGERREVESKCLKPSVPPSVHLERLWEHMDVPQHHREMYAARYITADYRPDILLREAAALVQGQALVQKVMSAIDNRESALKELARLRACHCDDDFVQIGGPGRRALADGLLAVRDATVAVVEALAAWRRSVAPLPGSSKAPPQNPPDTILAGRRTSTPAMADAGNADEQSRLVASSVVGPCGRGVCWPWGLARADYLWHVAHDDSVVRSFANVLDVSPVCDPLLIHSSSAPPGWKLSVPPVHSSKTARVEAAKLQLLEDEITLAVFSSVGKGSGDATYQTLVFGSAASEAHVKGCGFQLAHAGPSTARNGQVSSPRSPVAASAASPRNRAQGKGGQAEAFGERSIPRRNWRLLKQKMGSPDGSGKANARMGLDTVAFRKQITGESFVSSTPPRQVSDAPIKMHDYPKEKANRRNSQLTLSGNTHSANNPAFVRKVEGVFRRFGHDGCIHRDDMVAALEASGIVKPIRQWVDEVYREVTAYPTVSFQEFLSCVFAYDKKASEKYRDEFNRCDVEKSGAIDAAQLALALDRSGIDPMSHVLEEAIRELDCTGNGTLDLEEFYHVVHLLKEQEGFDKKEYFKLLGIYDKFAQRATNMGTNELMQALTYLGYVIDDQTVDMIAHEVDIEGGGDLNRGEFVSCMRRVREHDLNRIRLSLKKDEHWGALVASSARLKEWLQCVGHFPEKNAIAETCADLGIKEDGGVLDIGKLWKFLSSYRDREGLSRKDVEDIRASASRYAQSADDGEIELAIDAVGHVFRSMGFWISFEQQQLLVQRVDSDNSRKLRVPDLCKMIRMCQEQVMKSAADIFHRYLVTSNSPYTIPAKIAAIALRDIGCVSGAGVPPSITRHDLDPTRTGVDLDGFIKVVRRHTMSMRKEAQETGGFSSEEREELRRQFEKFDVDGSGDIAKDEIAHVIHARMEDMATDPALRPKLLTIIEESDENNDGSLDFNDFLRLMRHCQDIKDMAALEKERQAVQSTGFSASEVQEFRELFLSRARRKDHKLPWAKFCQLMEVVCPLGQRNMIRLRAMFRTITGCKSEDNEETDFADFMRLMRRILDTNFGNVKERSELIVGKRALNTKAPHEDSPLGGTMFAVPRSP